MRLGWIVLTHYTNMSATMKSLETQVGQLATGLKNQRKCKFPSNTKQNPRDHCIAITLRSGREVECSRQEEKGKEVEVETEIEVEKDEPNGVPKPKGISFLDNPPIISPPLPFPQRLQKKKLDSQFSKFLEIFKKIQINIPFVDAMQQMLNYAKFMKEVMAKKRKLEDYETIKLTEECSVIFQRKLPQKVKDPGSFTILCTVGGSNFEKALCDLRASINLMSLLIFRKLGLGEVKQTTILLQMADRSLTYLRGVIKDVLVKVDKFIFPVDFVVLDMDEDQEIPLILGRPFLATGIALIDVHSDNLTLRVNDEEVRFNIYHTMKFPDGGQSCNRISVVDECVKSVIDGVLTDDPFEHCLVHSSFKKQNLPASEVEVSCCDVGDEQWECVLALESLPSEQHDREWLDVTVPVFEESKSPVESSSYKREGPVLKQLPDHLHYSFLGGQSEFLVVILPP